MKLSDIKLGANVRGGAKASPSLVASVAKDGIIQPLVIDEDGTLIAGFRRYDAARELGLADVPVHVRTEATNGSRIGVQVAENVERERLHEWDLAQAALDLKDEGLKQAEVAAELNITAKQVSALQKVGKLDLERDAAVQFTMEGLLDMADVVKDTELPAEDLASAVISGESRDMWGATRKVQHDIDEVAIADELVELQKEWSDLGIEVVMEQPNLTGETDRHGYPAKNNNVLRVTDDDYSGGLHVAVTKHITEPCHLIQIIPAKGFGHTSWTHWCNDVKRHKAKGKSDVKAPAKVSASAMSDDEKEDRRVKKEAKDLRRVNAGVWLTGKLGTNRDIHSLAVPEAASNIRSESVRAVVLALIEQEVVEKRPTGADYDWYDKHFDAYLEDRFGDDGDKRAAWTVKAVHAAAYIETPDYSTGRRGKEAIEVKDEA